MTSIFEPLFDTYGDSVMREHGVFDETELMKALDGLSWSSPQRTRSATCCSTAISAGPQPPLPWAPTWGSPWEAGCPGVQALQKLPQGDNARRDHRAQGQGGIVPPSYCSTWSLVRPSSPW